MNTIIRLYFYHSLYFLIGFLVLCGCSAQHLPIDKPSTILVINEGKQMVVVSEKEDCLAFFDLPLTSEIHWRKVKLPGKPSGIVASKDEKIIWVTCGDENGKLLSVDLLSASITKTIEIGHYPISPAISDNNNYIFACRRFSNEVVCVDIRQDKIKKTISVKSEPVALAVIPGQSTVLVAHHRPATSSVADVVASTISVIDAENLTLIKEILLPNGSSNIRRMALSPDGSFAYIPHTIGRYQIPTTQLERGWMNTNALSIIDVANLAWKNTVLLDDLDMGAANPWDIDVTDDLIVVSHAGSHEISKIDRKILHQKLNQVNKGDTIAASHVADEIPNDLTFLLNCRDRIPLNANGPRSLSIWDNQVYVACYFSNSIKTVNLSNNRLSTLIASDYRLSKIERGEMYFNDADLCFQQWQSCASCHPDGRTDGLNWDLVNDGIGNPKNTKSMLFAHDTPPAMITGIRPNAEYAVRTGMRYIQFVERPEENAVCIDAYLKSLQPVKSPYLVNGKLSDAAKRGKILFESAECAKCHKGKYYTDMKLYEVGVSDNYPPNKKFDTPTLCEVWRTAPYLYDGRASTLNEMMRKYNPENKHGNTGNLNQDQLNDLSEYILSL